MANSLRLQCTVPDGACNLNGYPFLLHAPEQWGPRVVIVGPHIPAGDIRAAREAGLSVDDLAAAFGCSIYAVCDALRWAESHPDC